MALGAEPGEVRAVSRYRLLVLVIHSMNESRFTHVLVASSHNGDNASLEESLDGTVDGRREVTTQRHVHNSLALLSSLLDVVNDELHALENARVAAAARSIQDLDSNKIGLLGNAKGSTGDGTSDVAAMSVLIVILVFSQPRTSPFTMLKSHDSTYDIVNEVASESGTALKLSVSDLDTSVDHIGHNALASGVVKDVGILVGLSVRKTVETWGGVDLGDGTAKLDMGIGLDVGNFVSIEKVLDHQVVGIERHGSPLVHLERVDGGGKVQAVEASLVEVSLLDGHGKRGLLGADGIIVEVVVVEDDNVLVGNDVLGIGVREHGSEEGADSDFAIEFLGDLGERFGHILEASGQVHGGGGGEGGREEQGGEEIPEDRHDDVFS